MRHFIYLSMLIMNSANLIANEANKKPTTTSAITVNNNQWLQYGLSKSDWNDYQKLLLTADKEIINNVDNPLTILGYYAKNATKAKYYAELLVKYEAEKLRKAMIWKTYVDTANSKYHASDEFKRDNKKYLDTIIRVLSADLGSITNKKQIDTIKYAAFSAHILGVVDISCKQDQTCAEFLVEMLTHKNIAGADIQYVLLADNEQDAKDWQKWARLETSNVSYMSRNAAKTSSLFASGNFSMSDLPIILLRYKTDGERYKLVYDKNGKITK